MIILLESDAHGKSTMIHQLKVFILLTLLLTPLPSYAVDRILVVGDSWAAGVAGFRIFEQVFEARGIEGVEVVGNKTAIGGSRADQWATNHQGKLDVLTSELEAHPTIDIVHLSIGGNDFLNHCFKNDITEATPETRTEKWEAICSDIEKIVERILQVRPGARVLLCDYDFLDPKKIGETYGLHAKGAPSTGEMNAALVELGRSKLALARRIDRLEYVQNYGLLQFHFGIEGMAEPKTVPFPGKPPDYAPFPGGNTEYGSGVGMPDGVHPTPEGYFRIVENCFDPFYAVWLGSSE